jgi:hypothetical protein
MRTVRNSTLIFCVAVLAAFVGACPGPLPDALPTTLPDVVNIRDNTNLTPQAKRAALANLGFTPVEINGLLKDTRIANQFGGDLRTAYEKVTGGRFTELTPDEVQIYGDTAQEVEPTLTYTLSDTQAQAIVDFFQNNGVSTKDALAAFLDDPAKAASISADIPSGALNDLFVTFDTTLLANSLP